MNPNLRKRLDDVESVLSQPNVCSVPWTAFTATFEQLVGETWEDLRDRANRWLAGEEVPGHYGTKDRRCRQALLVSFADGEIRTETISIGDTDSDGVNYRRIPPDKCVTELINRRLQEWSEQIGNRS